MGGWMPCIAQSWHQRVLRGGQMDGWAGGCADGRAGDGWVGSRRHVMLVSTTIDYIAVVNTTEAVLYYNSNNTQDVPCAWMGG